MKNAIIKFGGYASLVGGLMFIGSHYIVRDIDFNLLEIFGYASIFASLTFVFFGIKHFRDQLNQGVVTFGKALIIGLAISAIAGVVIGVLDIIYVEVINPDFVSEYLQYSLEGLKETLSVAEFEEQKAVLTEQMKLFEKPAMSGLLMFGIVFSIGIIVSLISSLILQRKK